MGSADGWFLASTENYVELEYMLLKGAYLIFADLYLRAVRHSLSRLLNVKALSKVDEMITSEIARCCKIIKLTGLQLTQFIAKSYEGRPEKLKAKCVCGEDREWAASDDWFNFCRHCGTKYGIVEWPQDIGYVLTIQGPCDVVGSIHPQIDDLTPEDRARVYALWEEFKQNKRALELDSEYLIPAAAVRDLQTFTVPAYVPRNQQLVTFVSGKKLAENDGVPIVCNCGCFAILKKGFKRERWECFGCGSTIKMLALEGDPGYIAGLNPDGSPKLIPVQGSDAKSLNELTAEEKDRMLKAMLASVDKGSLNVPTPQP
jgi:hypothetical protein